MDEATKQAVKAWHDLFASDTGEIDPNDEYHWESLAYGFFLGQGLDPETAKSYSYKYDRL